MSQDILKNTWGSNRFWNRVAVVAGVFALLVGVLMIANYIQFKKADPVNMPVINSLVERLNENPADSSLRTQIRTLDLLSRKAYFTSQWQIRTGGYMLLAALALMIIAMQVIEYRKKINPMPGAENTDETLLQNRKARKWIVISGAAILVATIFFGFLTKNDLTERLGMMNRGSEASLVRDLESGEIQVNNLDLSDSTASVAEQTANDTSGILPSTAEKTTSENPTPTAINDNFPNFRGNAGVSTKKNIPVKWDGASGTNVLWKTAIPLAGNNSPIIWGDNIYVTGSSTEKQEIYAFNRNSGELLWSVRVGNGTKKPKVNEETGYAAPTAVADANGVYAIFATGDIAGVSPDGKKMWERDLGLPENHYGHASSLAYANGNIIVQFDQRSSQKIMALSAENGATVWSTGRTVKTSWSSPIVAGTPGGNLVLTVAEPYMVAYNPANGKELWKIECISGEVGPSPAYSNGIVFSVNDYSKVTAIKIGDQPSVLWETDEYLSDIPSPAANDKYLFLATSYGTMVCYDAVTGEKYWEKDFGKNIYASPMIVENRVYVSDISGVMHIFAADKEFKPIAESKLGEFIAATPAFTNGRIYLRGEATLYCIGK
ncbi:MAG TPA: PQQ-binding-like beta-propeller repeat protein [Bacteroidales bacterium]|nr:PQQ-binding-like beta-propeller repeat protein [Bacteroidales bacterium]